MNQLAKWGYPQRILQLPCAGRVAGGVEGRGQIREEGGGSLQEKCPSGAARGGCVLRKKEKKRRSGPVLGRRTTRAQPPTWNASDMPGAGQARQAAVNSSPGRPCLSRRAAGKQCMAQSMPDSRGQEHLVSECQPPQSGTVAEDATAPARAASLASLPACQC